MGCSVLASPPDAAVSSFFHKEWGNAPLLLGRHHSIVKALIRDKTTKLAKCILDNVYVVIK